ncbi:hypothetical protein OG871_03530 [Kitasatospora sp. NBC_00374]|uniref:hypothetical protein n=1 Tax=Kitasatospora sp. NBC_00374 TaxID=2975964 RepID=UPI0030E511B7
MSGQIRVDAVELRASARVAESIAEELGKPADTAVTASRAAAGPLAGWSVSAALESMADGWAPTLAKVRDRFTTTAANLQRTADGHEWNDRAVAEVWQRQDAR